MKRVVTGHDAQGRSVFVIEDEPQPVVLEKADFDQWMNGTSDEAAQLMKPAADDVLQKWPVSKRINSSRTPKDDRTLIDKVELTA